MGMFSSLFGKGNKSAYDTSGLAAATQQSNDLYKKIYEGSVSAGSPWLQLGQQGVSGLSSQLGSLTTPFSQQQFMADPSYQFLQDEAAKAVQRSASAQGSLFAPSTAKALQDRATSLASTEYNNAFNRDLAGKSQIYDMLMGASNVGQNQLAQNTQGGWNYADAVSGNNIGLQNAILGSYQAKNAAQTQGWSNLLGTGMTAAALFSDRRLKTNIKRIGRENGFPLYEFSYAHAPAKKYIGVMAQDVAKIMPEAVGERDGYMTVNYGMIGLNMKEAN